ncbi:ABC transporter ATP-binding protein [Niallia oryzisoli]|uniref:ABC transporter ATP-binding protein n=1 Tax=Niallia oryzisoli TaxID=1737571 RepID=A0ABZ2CJX1_9BACI
MRFTKIKPKIKKNLDDQKTIKTNSIQELVKLALPYKRKILLACVCALLVNASALLQPYILKLVIDDFLINGVVQTGFYSIISMGILYLFLSFLGGFSSFAQVNLMNSAGQKIVTDLRNRVFKTIQLLPLSYLDKNSSGRLITRSTNDINDISNLYTDVIMNLFKDVILLIGIVYVMLSLNLELTMISMLVIPIMVFLLLLMRQHIRKSFLSMKHYIGKLNGFIAESISGMKIIQIFNAEKEKEEEFLELNNTYTKTTLLQTRINSIMRPASDLFQNLAIASLIWYSVDKIFNHTLQIGVLYAFTTYIKQFFAPVSDLADKYSSIQSALVSTERVFDLLKQKDSLEDLDRGVSKNRFKGSIEFKNVWFSYNNKDWVLKNVSFKIDSGQMAAFVGETGAGKSTIICLINGFYKVQKGKILIDGVDINTIKLKDIRKNISVILQDVFLFSGTIKSNITLNDPIDDKVIENAVKVACVDRFINDFPNHLNEPVLERGNTLSAGQRQLISFARAIVHDPSVLVLDEATANIDTYTEKLIQQAIENISKNRTTLIIAHRLSTIQNADVIFVMKHGEIIEFGNDLELNLLNGYYKKMLEESELTKNQVYYTS